ncbi:MAG: hypothetical protein COB02_16505 [Candidatus Cloacimonadota bacterium]|nr:MAG: hypothetical protein COB02_16505 [Candidatus Cloacimonadota bacterium]
MRLTLFIFLAMFTFNTITAVDFVPLNMKLGLWEYENPSAKILEKMFASMPAEVKQVMKSKMKKHKPIQSCLTKKDMKDPNHFIQKMGDSNCIFDLVKSTKTLFEGNLNCTNSAQASSINVIMEVVNDKKVISKTTMDTASFPGGDMGKISATGIWISDVCPASLNKE